MHNQQQNTLDRFHASGGFFLLDDKNYLLQELLRTLAAEDYSFTTVTPLSHELFFERTDGIAKNNADIFGWGLPFAAETLSPVVFELLSRADLLSRCGSKFKSQVRVSSLGDDLFLHSSFPTTNAQSVFFGPDTYRFARFIKQSLQVLQLKSDMSLQRKPYRILDVGCGTGAGGVSAVRSLAADQPYELSLNDINPIALDYAFSSTQAAAIPAALLYGDFFHLNNTEFDLIVTNPPYLMDSSHRLYRDGGAHLGLDLSLKILKHGLRLLAPGGNFLLYTGVAMTDVGKNPLLMALTSCLQNEKYQWFYEEIDPDIFGEELQRIEYRDVNRIAAIGLIVKRLV